MQQKMRDFSILKKRILQFIDYKGISKYEFYQLSGISNGILSQKNGFSEENILKILSAFGEISPFWLLTGEGDMLKSSPNVSPLGSPVTQPVPPPVQTDQSPGSGCKLCIEKDQRIADLQKSIEMWETHFKTLSTNFQSVVQSYMSDKQYLQDQIEILQQQHFDDEQDVTSQAG